MRLSIWLEQEMRRRFGSRELAKREIFARAANLNYLGNGRYGFAAASEYYFGRPVSSYAAEGRRAGRVAGGDHQVAARLRPGGGRSPAACAAATRSWA